MIKFVSASYVGYRIEFYSYENLRLNLSLSYSTVFMNLKINLVTKLIRSHQEGNKIKVRL